MLKIGVCGAAGRMGKTIIEVCDKMDNLVITAAVEREGSPVLGRDAGEVADIEKLGITIDDDISVAADKVDIVIDFTSPVSLTGNIKKCVAAGIKMVIGTTGLSDIDHALMRSAAEKVAIVYAPNMSIGVNLCLKLLETATIAIGGDADIEIIEAHHRHKKDAPSGTAIRMGEVIADTRGQTLKECAVYGRQGTLEERDQKAIAFETIRAGDIIGEHTVMFATEGERIEIAHKASSRKIFATGALKAAQWLSNKKTGLFNMQDVLNLK